MPQELKNGVASIIEPKAEYLVDKQAILSVQDVQKRKNEFLVANFGEADVNTKDAVWFRFEFKNSGTDFGRWMLYHSLVRADSIEFYCVRSSGVIQKFIAGDLVEFDKKQVPSRYQTLFFELQPNETIEIFAKVKTKSRITPNFVLTSAHEFIKKNSGENLGWGMYFGFFIAMILHGFWLFVSLRDKLYGVYTANLFSLFAMMFISYGFIQPMLPGYLLPHTDILPHFFGVFAMLMLTIFLALFFNTKNKYKKIHFLLLGAAGLFAFLSVLFAFDVFKGEIARLHTNILIAVSLCYALLAIFVSAFMMYKKENWSGYILAISIINAVWIVILVLTAKVIVDDYGMVENVSIVKNFLHVTVLSVVLGLRFSQLKKEKEISEKLFAEQSKRSIAGDTVSNITHQWKQPIAELSAVLSAVQADIKLSKIEPDALQKDCNKAFSILEKMASSVDFFQDFFRLEAKNEKLYPEKIIKTVLDVYGRPFETLGVTVQLRCEDGCVVYADSNGLLQVISAILQNSKEVFEHKNIDRPIVDIAVYRQGGFAVMEFADNGGGCDEPTIKNIFNPFFGTKKNSTGSGLYLAKIIVEQKMNGLITVGNKDGGLCVSVRLPFYLSDNR